MNKEEVLTMEKIPYLSTTKYLFDQLLIFGFDRNEKRKDVYEELIEKIVEKCKEGKDSKEVVKVNKDDRKPPENSCLITNKIPLLHAISSKPDGSTLSPDLISSIIFPNDIKVHYQIGDVSLDALNIQSNKNIIFLINGDSTAGDSKNIFNGYAYVYYEKYKSSIRIPTENQPNPPDQDLMLHIPKAFCFISHYPFFAHFSLLSQKILDLFSMKDLEIPIEILLHNLITFTPAPIGLHVKINFFPSGDLSKSIDTLRASIQEPSVDTKKTDNTIIFNCLSGYPLCDFNLSELFNILPLEHIVEILIFSFLEIDLLLFSKDLEVLNLVLYIFSILGYPANDSPYLWHIVSVSPKGLIDPDQANNFVGKPFTTMLGINCTYSKSLDLSKFSKSTFVVDIDNSEFMFKCYPDQLDSEQYEECLQLEKLHAYIEKIIMSQDQPKSPFEENLIKFVEEIGRISNKAEILNPNEGKEFYNFYKGISYQFNTKIQDIFYTFILNLLKHHSMTNPLMLKKQDSLGNQTFSSSDFNNVKSIEEEKLFHEFFMNSTKHSFYYQSFLSQHSPLDCYRISLHFNEEFIQLKNSIEDEYKFQHFSVIDNFYMSNVKTVVIDFSEFYSYYINELTQGVYGILRENKLFTCIKKSMKKQNKKVIKYLYHYNRTELDDDVAFDYAYSLSNLNDVQLNKVFPSLALIREPSVLRIAYREIVEPIESFFLKLKSFQLEDIISFSIILFYSFTINFMNFDEFNQQFDFIYKLILQQRFFVRKYIAMIISIYYNKLVSLKEQSAEYDHILNAFKRIKDLIAIRQVQPNEELTKLLARFEKSIVLDNQSKGITSSNEVGTPTDLKPRTIHYNSPDKNRASSSFSNENKVYLEEKEEKVQKEGKEVKEKKDKKAFKEIKEEKEAPSDPYQGICVISLDANICKENNKTITYDEAYIAKLCSNMDYEGDIKIICEDCSKPLAPQIKVQVVETKNVIDCEIFSSIKIYRTCSFLMMNWLLVGMKPEAFDKKMLRKLMINLLFYHKIKPTLSSPLIPISTFSVVEKK